MIALRSITSSIDRSVSPLQILITTLLGLALGVAVAAIGPIYVVAAIVGVAVAAGVLASTQFSLLAFVAVATLVPFAVIPVRIGFQLTAVDALLSGLLVVWLVRTLARAERIHLTSVGGLLIAYLAVNAAAFILGYAQAPDPDLARQALKLLNSMLFFFVVANCVREQGQVGQLLKALMLGGSLAAAIGVVLHLQSPETIVRALSALRVVGYPSGAEVLRYLPADGNTYSDVLRATGTSIDPNVFGGLLMVTLAIVVAQLVAQRPLLSKPALGVMGAVLLVGLVLSYSRSAWVGLAVGVVYLGTFRYRRALILAILAVAVLLYLPIGQQVLGRFQEGLAGQDPATVMRFSEYRNAVEIIARYPVLGIGFGAAPSIDLYPGVSSLYLLIAEQTGLVGLGLFLAIVGRLLLGSVRALLAPGADSTKAPLVALQAALLSALAAGVFDHYFANKIFPHMVAMLWLLLALLWRTTELTHESRRAE